MNIYYPSLKLSINSKKIIKKIKYIMIDIRKMDIWYSEDIDNFDRYNQKKK